MAYRHALASLVLAALLLGGAPAAAPAQCRLCDTPQTAREPAETSARIQLEVSAVLDFDRLVLVGAGDGAATLLPNGERSASGTVAALSGRAMVGSVTVRGEPGKALVVALPRRIDLHSLSGAKIAVEDIESDLPSLPKLDSAGTLTFQFGGRLTIRGDADGDYRGDVPIDIDYL